MMRHQRLFHSICALVLALAPAICAQVPQLINYQGRIAVGTVNFDGSGQFKFAMVNATGGTTYWSNNGTSIAGSEPTAAVTLPVSKGLYSVLLGDATLANMTTIPNSVFNNGDVRLRVWFSNGINGSQLLSPDQRIAAVGYAIMAGNVPDGSITSAKLAAGAGAAPIVITGTTANAEPNRSYVTTNAALTTLTLPTNPNVGDVVSVSGVNDRGLAADAPNYIVQASPGQTISHKPKWVPLSNYPSSFDNLLFVSSDATSLTTFGIDGSTGTSSLFRSSNGGNTWTNHPIGYLRIQDAWATSADGVKMAAALNDAITGQAGLATSSDSGATWTFRTTDYVYSIAGSSDMNKLVAIMNSVGGELLFTSINSGVTWTQRETARVWTDVASSSDGQKLIACVNGGKLYTSNNAGVSWTARDSDHDWSSVISSSDGVRLAAYDNTSGVYVSANSGVNWTKQTSLVGGTLFGSADLKTVIIGSEVSEDFGATWNALPRLHPNYAAFALGISGNGKTILGTVSRTDLHVLATVPMTQVTGLTGSAMRLQYLGGNRWRQWEELSQ